MTDTPPEFAEDAANAPGFGRGAGGKDFAKAKGEGQAAGAAMPIRGEGRGVFRESLMWKNTQHGNPKCDKLDQIETPVLLFWSGTTSERMAEILMKWLPDCPAGS